MDHVQDAREDGRHRPGNSGDNTIRLLGATLGLPIQLVSGYKEWLRFGWRRRRGKSPGPCPAQDSLAENLEAGEVIPLVASDAKALARISRRLAIDLVKGEEARKLIESVSITTARLRSPAGSERPRISGHAAPSIHGHDERREFSGELKKARLDVDPVAGEELERIINEAFKLGSRFTRETGRDIFYK